MKSNMKKSISKIICLAGIAAAAWACSKEWDVPSFTPAEPVGPRHTLEAWTDDEASKSFLDGNGEILWNAGDAISVFDGTANRQFTTAEEGAKGVFEYYGQLSQEESYALYPYDASAAVSANAITTTLPTTQTAVAGSFAQGANLAVGYTAAGQVQFKNAVAYARVGFKSEAGAQIKKIRLVSLDETVRLSGKATLTVTLSDEGQVADVVTTITDGVPYAEVEAPEGEFLVPDTDYYITLAPGALKGGYRVEFTDADGLVFGKSYDTDVYKAAVLKRNTIAGVGKKNVDNIEIEGWWRQHTPKIEEGNYLAVYKMNDGSYRIFDDYKTDTYIVKGTHFELSGSKMVGDPQYLADQMEGMVAYVFRNAWRSSSILEDHITFSNDKLIQSTDLLGLNVNKYTSGSGLNLKSYYYTNVTLYNRTDNKTTIVTMDDLGYISGNSADQGYIKACFNKKSASTNSGGNANTCSDLVDALLLHASFKVSIFDVTSTVKNNAINYLEGDDNAFQIGFTTALHTSMNGVKSQNHFMLKTGNLLSGADIQDIYIYKKATQTYADYIAY